jgi:propanediol dehydratase small subunit
MFFEGTIRLERSDKNTLLADLQAIEDLLQSRRAARIIERAESIFQEAA